MLQNASLTIAVALTAGMLGHALARHLRLPSILVLLFLGVLLGPDGAGLVLPDTLGNSLFGLVNGAVAIILFEGGLRLQLNRLRLQPVAIRRLVTVGGALSAIGGALAARLVLGWGWSAAGLFGVLMMVTGPTVVTPLLERLRVRGTVGTVLEAEGVLIDAVGAVAAAVALEVALHPSEEGMLLAGPEVAWRLGFGAAVGLIGGGLLALFLRYRRLIPIELQNPLALATVLLIYETADSFVHESGLAAATVAGITLGNVSLPGLRSLADFKQQLVRLLIGMLFLLLVADVRLATVIELGWAGALTVAILMFVVRPIVAFVCTWGTSLDWRERVLIAWLSPRGVVAAAISSLFAFSLQSGGAGGGLELRALVFATIAASVVWCSVTGAPVASLLGLRKPMGRGWVVLGGNSLARRLVELLDHDESRCVLLDNDPQLVRAAETSGLRALHGNALEHRMLARAELEQRSGAIGVTANPEANLLFAQQAHRSEGEMRCLVALRDELDGVTSEVVRAQGANVLFGGPIDIDLWSRRLERCQAKVEWWTCIRPRPAAIRTAEATSLCIPLASRARGGISPVGDDTRVGQGQQVAFVVDAVRRDDARAWLRRAGFEPANM